MLGAIAGDIIGSVYERHPIKPEVFELFSSRCTFTDDTAVRGASGFAPLQGRTGSGSVKDR